MSPAAAPTAATPPALWRRAVGWPLAWAEHAARWLFGSLNGLRRLIAFGLITLGVLVTHFGHARAVVWPVIFRELHRGGVKLLPLIVTVGGVLGLLLIGQAVALLIQLGAADLTGRLVVTLVVRELAPLLTAAFVLLRVGTPMVVELGAARANGEVEALEALGVDPVHYLVMPRVVGLSLAACALNIYALLAALAGGWLLVLLRELPLTLTDFLGQIAAAMDPVDFVLLFVKSALFGAIIALAACYHGLAYPLRADQIPGATTRAVEQTLLVILLADAALLAVRLVL
jgi:phospholipid/cholesterol/gamma-HCH transport system permease protein